MYFEDLTVYEYSTGSKESQIYNVGWLDAKKSFNQQKSSNDFLNKLFQLCLMPINETRGFHQCPFCTQSQWGLEVERNSLKVILGGAEIRIKGLDGQTYAAPDLIYHYVEAHDYAPPKEFIKAVLSSQ
jgi:hypothetical protein